MLKPVVLVVEDDILVRMLAVDTVETAGYTAVEASDADDAIVILESRTDIALIMTNVDMPGSMNGLKLAHAARNRWPPVKIIVVSGKAHLFPSQLPSDARFIAKPYSQSMMVAELKSWLGSSL